MIELPVIARKLDYMDPSYSHNLTNSEASSLFANCESAESASSLWPIRRFGLPPEEWQLGIGPVLIARADLKPLHLLHAAALVAFCSQHLVGKFAEYNNNAKAWVADEDGSINTSLDKQARQKVLDCVTKENFAFFFETYKKRRVAGVHESADDLDEAFQAWDVPMDERIARPEWADVPSPYDV